MNATDPDPQPEDGDQGAFDRLRVALGARSYDILIGTGLLDDAGRHVAPLIALRRVALITDANVESLYRARVERSLSEQNIAVEAIVLPAGEQTKDFAHLEDLLDRLLGANAERGMTLIALGGGVTGDLTGFAASILLRGVDFIQLPTTLLAQVDSSVGGKTGINSRHGKNLIGSFHQPRLVLADTGTLDTLPPRELRAGYAEVAKYGLIGDDAFFGWLEQHGAAVIAGGDDERRHAVAVSCRAKARIVEQDEREAGQRALLNLGHTFAHALEAETGYGTELLHGEAVALGMVLAFRLSARLGLCAPEDAERIARHLSTIGLPTRLADLPPRRWHADSLIDHMSRDKKIRAGHHRLVLARGIGQAFVADDVPVEKIRAELEAAITQSSAKRATPSS